MEGFLRWFQGLSSCSSSTTSSQNDIVQQPHLVDEGRELKNFVIKEFDFSALKPTKVPQRPNHRIAFIDPHKVSP